MIALTHFAGKVLEHDYHTPYGTVEPSTRLERLGLSVCLPAPGTDSAMGPTEHEDTT